MIKITEIEIFLGHAKGMNFLKQPLLSPFLHFLFKIIYQSSFFITRESLLSDCRIYILSCDARILQIPALILILFHSLYFLGNCKTRRTAFHVLYRHFM
ncbi:hypothetical protein SAMN05443252_104121 [Bacillus sp. OV322]|nr:hypothetical protein SAMN05443252_104121 [Bacillus sp. OV322]